MNEATIATYEVHGPEIHDYLAEPAGPAARQCAASRPYNLLNIMANAANRPSFDAVAVQQVREDKGFYVPDFMSDEKYDANIEGYSAAAKHAKHIRRAERLLDEAQNLVGLLLASLCDESDSRAMQTETALTIIDKKMTKAHNRIDKHETHHTNLFLAYFDLKGQADGVESD